MAVIFYTLGYVMVVDLPDVPVSIAEPNPNRTVHIRNWNRTVTILVHNCQLRFRLWFEPVVFGSEPSYFFIYIYIFF